MVSSFQTMIDIVLSPFQSTAYPTRTLFVVAGAVALGVVIWILGKRLNTRIQSGNAEIIRAVLIFLLTAVAAGLLLAQWDATGEHCLSLGWWSSASALASESYSRY